MTKKIYKTAQGKAIDLGALILQNENVRAVGNMNVNARGDLVDGVNATIDKKNRQVQRQYQQAQPASAPMPAKQFSAQPQARVEPQVQEAIDKATEAPAQEGLAAAMARSRASKKAQ